MSTYPARNRKDFYVTLGAIDFAASDDELAVLIAHQIAHFLVADLTDESVEAEISADRLGLYLAARAGHDPTVASGLLERLTLEKPEMLNRKLEPRWRRRYSSIHLFAPERLVAMPTTLSEIAAKQAAGEPLHP